MLFPSPMIPPYFIQIQILIHCTGHLILKQKICIWFAANRLLINTTKTNYILFHTHCKKYKAKFKNYNIYLNNNIIERKIETLFLGVVIHENLFWSSHQKRICSKISKYIGILNKLKHFFPQNILLNLYNSFILPHLQYCNIIWEADYSTNLKLQKRAVRSITFSHFLSHSEPYNLIF